MKMNEKTKSSIGNVGWCACAKGWAPSSQRTVNAIIRYWLYPAEAEYIYTFLCTLSPCATTFRCPKWSRIELARSRGPSFNHTNSLLHFASNEKWNMYYQIETVGMRYQWCMSMSMAEVQVARCSKQYSESRTLSPNTNFRFNYTGYIGRNRLEARKESFWFEKTVQYLTIHKVFINSIHKARCFFACFWFQVASSRHNVPELASLLMTTVHGSYSHTVHRLLRADASENELYKSTSAINCRRRRQPRMPYIVVHIWHFQWNGYTSLESNKTNETVY